MANNSLDLIGQARLLYQHVATLQGNGATEDTLAYFRDTHEFRNGTLAELPAPAITDPVAKKPIPSLFDTVCHILAAPVSHRRRTRI